MILSIVLLASLFTSCTTGEYLPLKDIANIDILGIIYATFNITGAFRYRSVINTQAYMHLLAEAQKIYSDVIDVGDITWAIGKSDAANNNYEYTAVGKAYRTKSNN